MLQARWSTLFLGLLFLASVGLLPTSGAPVLQPVTTNDVSVVPPETGGGDSHSPVFSADGRYVLFASAANNLVAADSNTPYTAQSPARLNVYLRDRTNGVTQMISLNLAGTGGGNGGSLPVGISSNGQYALFESDASDLVEGDTNDVADIFLRDTVNNQTLHVNASTNGGFANGQSRQSVMTPDARYVAFASTANNLVPGDTNGLRDIFVRDLQSGTTVLASPGAKTSGSSDGPLITPDGRYVAFLSSAANLVPGVPQKSEVYVRDLVGGTTSVVSTNAHQFLTANSSAYNHALSDDGQYVAFQGVWTAAINFRYHLPTHSIEVIQSNAVAQLNGAALRSFHNLDMTPNGRFVAFIAKGSGTNTTQVYLWDGLTSTTNLVSQDLSGNESTNSLCDYPVVDETGRYVAFLSTATNLTTNVVADGFHLYVRDLQESTTRLVDANSNGVAAAKDFLNAPSFADGGRLVAFDSTDADLVPNDRNLAYDVFVRDLTTETTELISMHDPGLASQTPAGIGFDAQVAVSADGRYVAFASFPGTMLANNTNPYRAVFVRDLQSTSNLLVSVDTNGLASDGMSLSPAISGDGRWVAFSSLADNLVIGDTNKAQDVFVRDVQIGATLLVSVSTNGVDPGDKASSDPIISTDGRYVLFRSRATNLAPGAFGSATNLFLRDLQSALTFPITTTGASCAAMTPDGRWVAFGGAAGSMYVWDTLGASLVYSNSTLAVSTIAISSDGNRIAGLRGSQVYVSDRSLGSNWVLVSSSLPASRSHAGLQFSADGRFLVYTTAEPLVSGDTNGTTDVYLYDFVNQTIHLVSHGYDSLVGNGASDAPQISSNGRFVAWRSLADNLIPGDTNGVADVFLYDRTSEQILLLSGSAFGAWTGNDHSGWPLFSADGQTIIFQSWASDLVTQDFNQTGDLFAIKLLPSSPEPAFSVQILQPSALSAPTLTWPVVWGNSYRVQYKSDLRDEPWLDLNSPVTVVGDRAWTTDLEAGPEQRFYRVISY
jgi:Tol biopolymer transport system component